MTLVKILIIAGVLILIFGISAVFLAKCLWNNNQPNPAQLELFKSLLQVVLVVILGSIASFLVSEYTRKKKTIEDSVESKREKAEIEKERKRQQLENLNQFRRETLANIHKIYSTTKKARRLLRAKALSKATDDGKQTLINSDSYDEQTQIIIDLQLDLEILKEEFKTNVKTGSQTFSEPKELENTVKSMEKYLGRLIKEYEKNYDRSKDGDLALTNLNELKDFTGDYDKSKFRSEFVKNYASVLKLIRTDILESTKKLK